MNQTKRQTSFVNTHISPAGVGKRIGALLFDLLLVFIVMVFISLATVPYLQKQFDFATVQKDVEHERRQSYLFLTTELLLDDASNYDEVLLVIDPDRHELMPVPEEMFALHTYKFYTVFLEKDEAEPKYTDAWYIENVLRINDEDSLFTLIDPGNGGGSNNTSENEELVVVDRFLVDGVTFKAGITDAELQTFNRSIYGYALYLFSHRDVITHADFVVFLIDLINIIFLTVLSTSLFFLALPLFLKNGKTLGKLLFNLSVTTKSGFKISTFALLLRYFAFLFIEFAISAALSWLLFESLFFPLLPFISLTFIVFSERRRSLHDFVVGTTVVDDRKSVIYDNYEQYEHALYIEQNTTGRREYVNEERFEDRFKEGSGA